MGGRGKKERPPARLCIIEGEARSMPNRQAKAMPKTWLVYMISNARGRCARQTNTQNKQNISQSNNTRGNTQTPRNQANARRYYGAVQEDGWTDRQEVGWDWWITRAQRRLPKVPCT